MVGMGKPLVGQLHDWLQQDKTMKTHCTYIPDSMVMDREITRHSHTKARLKRRAKKHARQALRQEMDLILNEDEEIRRDAIMTEEEEIAKFYDDMELIESYLDPEWPEFDPHDGYVEELFQLMSRMSDEPELLEQ